MQKSLPDRPSLEQLKKQAKELVKNHRAQDASTFAAHPGISSALTGKTDRGNRPLPVRAPRRAVR